MSKLFALAFCAATGCAAAHGEAEVPWRRAVLVELFTSQGCSSCPAADQLVRELPSLGFGRDRVVPLTFHVDYWDGLGWKDAFADPAFTARQEGYNHSRRLRPADGESGMPGSPYTPQMIVDGAVHFSGARRALAVSEMHRAAGVPPLAQIDARATVAGDDASLVVRVTGALDRQQSWRLHAALAQRRARTPVHAGENAGAVLEEAAIVRGLADAPLPADPGAPIRMRLHKPHELPWTDVELVVFVQSDATLAVAATRWIPAGDGPPGPAGTR